MKCAICNNDYSTYMVEVKSTNPYGPIETSYWCHKQWNETLADLRDPTISDDMYITPDICPKEEETNAD